MCGGRHFISPAGLLIGGLAALQLVDDRPAPIQTRAAAPLVTEKNTNCSECGEVIHKVFNWCPACGSQLPKEPRSDVLFQPCAHCRQLLPSGVEACSYCGAPRE